ncbi:MAG: hypothetical protein KQH63_05315 [Desulfobulbaceae bacterium]|nr:hypothetical protein [Desulfobulbaceae bacterium]
MQDNAHELRQARIKAISHAIEVAEGRPVSPGEVLEHARISSEDSDGGAFASTLLWRGKPVLIIGPVKSKMFEGAPKIMQDLTSL